MSLSGLLLGLALAADPNPGLAVMDFAVDGASPELATALNGVAVHELERLGLFRVQSSETTRVILGVERQRQLLGCDTCSGQGLAELTSFKYLVTGKLSRTAQGKANAYLFMMTLLEAGSASPLSSVRVEARGEEQLLQELSPAVLKLVGKLAAARQGSLVVASSEVGAAVKVDDTQVGVTPLPGRLPVSAGPHLLSVEKDGFTTVRKEVRVTPEGLTDEYVRLVPSPDTIQAYEARATRLRVLAWVATGLAAAGVGATVGGTLAAERLYGDDSSRDTFRYYRARLTAGFETEMGPDGVLIDNRARAGALKAQVESMQAVALIGLGTAALGAITATVLFVVGDPPGRYDAYRGGTGLKVTLAPAPGGAVLSGSF